MDSNLSLKLWKDQDTNTMVFSLKNVESVYCFRLSNELFYNFPKESVALFMAARLSAASGISEKEIAWMINSLLAVPYHVDNKDGLESFAFKLKEEIPELSSVVECPECNRRKSLFDMIIHLNDYHKASRESIADWIDTLDIDTTFGGRL